MAKEEDVDVDVAMEYDALIDAIGRRIGPLPAPYKGSTSTST
jgi:hypothetical protein